jgi:hypothetical protein
MLAITTTKRLRRAWCDNSMGATHETFTRLIFDSFKIIVVCMYCTESSCTFQPLGFSRSIVQCNTSS